MKTTVIEHRIRVSGNGVKLQQTVKEICAGVVFLFCLTIPAIAAVPVITGFSSSGGTTVNKQNDQDTMYLANQGAALSFNASFDQPVTCEWAVNRATVQVSATGVAADTFIWTVPSRKDVWEVHLRAWNGLNEEVHGEWVLSTRSLNEAPKIFDYFTDGKYNGRYPSVTDPWGRPLPEWNVTGAWNTALCEARSDEGTLWLPCQITTGTWKIRYRYVNAPPTDTYSRGWYFYFISKANGSTLRFYNPPDAHWWIDYMADGELHDGYPRVPNSYPYVSMAGSQILPKVRVAGTSFHDVTIVRDSNGYIGTWLEGVFVQYSKDINREVTDSTKVTIKSYNLAGYTLVIDGIEIYENNYLIPDNDITCAAGTITINDFDGTLSRINAAVNDPAVFSYDPSSNAAVCNADILIKSGAELEITSGTLKMAGGKKIRYEREAMIYIEDSLLDSVDATPWNWAISPVNDDASYPAVVFSVINSTVNNCGGFSGNGVKTLYIKNSRFTDLVGTNPFYILFRRPPNGGLLISDSYFRGKTGTETIWLQGGDQFHQLQPKAYGMDIINTVFENIKFSRHFDWTYYMSPGYPGGTANLVNVKASSLGYEGASYRFKYYLDVQVVDADGMAVNDATVTVTNEQDDVTDPSENLLTGWQYLRVGTQVPPSGELYFDAGSQQANRFKGLVDVNDHRTTATGINGHTPLPRDTAGTIVLTAGISTDTVKINYTYTITAMKDGLSATMTGVRLDDTWYRADPNVPIKTVTIKLPGTFSDIHPAVSFVLPEQDTILSGKIMVELAVKNFAAAKAEFYIDAALAVTLTTAPYHWEWDTSTVPEGGHSIKALVYDATGNIVEKEVTVKVTKAAGAIVYPNPYIKGKSRGSKCIFGNLQPYAKVQIYSLCGEPVRTLKTETAGDNASAEWDVSDVAGGIYFYTIDAGGSITKGKLGIIK